jgi:hypothetical protein
MRDSVRIYLNAKQRARFFRINFRFYQVTFPYGAKTEEKQHQTLSENGGLIKRKSYVRDVYLFSLLDSYYTSEKLSERGEKLSNKYHVIVRMRDEALAFKLSSSRLVSRNGPR